MKTFKAKIEIIGINPFVFIPNDILDYLFEKAGKNKGKIPVHIKVEGNKFEQTLIKYSGHWRLYLNTPMRKSAKKEVGQMTKIEIEFDSSERKIPFHPKFRKALNENESARKIFDSLAPSLQKEILKYLSFLKTEKSIDKNVERAIEFLNGNTRFIGRDKP
ncbi:bacteriocin resistance YdeI/OmpD-like protein [Tenacibaculum gallaicum]|uniref:Bacteriocin resistance YdeI/OmpD-like protein n=1 Tax=Tenacibaculum gallaicum TaxID=561505 RepID=A0A3E0I198_9FLAO|nr:YdeI/OmpD-associated family protein [Tenacibaculum gallaicum]REH52508.1 bacteriocin resistance YdeI/OmpD-like protein [Tenacibaculum gallaicum]